MDVAHTSAFLAEPVEPKSRSSSRIYHVPRAQLDESLLSAAEGPPPPRPLRGTVGLPYPSLTESPIDETIDCMK